VYESNEVAEQINRYEVDIQHIKQISRQEVRTVVSQSVLVSTVLLSINCDKSMSLEWLPVES
jgi:hypothetical protein